MLCYYRKQVRGVGKSAALAADKQCLDSHLDYHRKEWDSKLRSLFEMQGRSRRIMFAHSCVLSYLEVWTKVNIRLSCMRIKCPWILPSFPNKMEYSRVRDINFKSA